MLTLFPSNTVDLSEHAINRKYALLKSVTLLQDLPPSAIAGIILRVVFTDKLLTSHCQAIGAIAYFVSN